MKIRLLLLSLLGLMHTNVFCIPQSIINDTQFPILVATGGAVDKDQDLPYIRIAPNTTEGTDGYYIENESNRLQFCFPNSEAWSFIRLNNTRVHRVAMPNVANINSIRFYENENNLRITITLNDETTIEYPRWFKIPTAAELEEINDTDSETSSSSSTDEPGVDTGTGAGAGSGVDTGAGTGAGAGKGPDSGATTSSWYKTKTAWTLSAAALIGAKIVYDKYFAKPAQPINPTTDTKQDEQLTEEAKVTESKQQPKVFTFNK